MVWLNVCAKQFEKSVIGLSGFALEERVGVSGGANSINYIVALREFV